MLAVDGNGSVPTAGLRIERERERERVFYSRIVKRAGQRLTASKRSKLQGSEGHPCSHRWKLAAFLIAKPCRQVRLCWPVNEPDKRKFAVKVIDTKAEAPAARPCVSTCYGVRQAMVATAS